MFTLTSTIVQGNDKLSRNVHKSEAWKQYTHIQDFDCYHYHWALQDEQWGTVEYHDAPVWINLSRDLLITFVINDHLINEIIQGVKQKFEIDCLPIRLTLNQIKRLQREITLVYSSNGESAIFITDDFSAYESGLIIFTSLLKNDTDRLRYINTLINKE